MTASSTLVSPAYFTHPDFYGTHGPEVGELCALVGFAPDPEQQMLLDVSFAFDRSGLPVADEVVVIAPRQNLKTGFFKQAALGKVFLLERSLFVWSAHEFSTTQEAFRDLQGLIEGCPSLDRQIKHIHQASGSEAIELLGGQRIKFKARTKSGGRGLTGDDVLLDEGFALQPTHMGALQPTMAARPMSQMFVGSSAGQDYSAVLRSMRDRGRKGSPRMVYAEWCTEQVCGQPSCSHEPGVAGCVLDDMGALAQANPQLGGRIKAHKVVSFRLSMPPAEFGREFAGWWDESESAKAVIAPAIWAALADRSPAPEPHVGRVALAIDTDPQRARTTIAAAGRRADGLALVEIVENRPGVEWAVARVLELTARHDVSAVVIDKRSAAGSLIGPLTEAKAPVLTCDAASMAQACGQFFDAASESGQLRHLDDPRLNGAVRAATTRPLGDAWAWDRKKPSADITPLTAATLALWGWQSSAAPRNAGRGRVVALS